MADTATGIGIAILFVPGIVIPLCPGQDLGYGLSSSLYRRQIL
jgi:hypothetical protein